jgi:hypothetical protein
MTGRWLRTSVSVAAIALLAGCAAEVRGTAIGVSPSGAGSTTLRAGTLPPGLTPDGVCESDASLDPSSLARDSEIVPGIGECDLVRIKGTKPTDVLIGESGKGQREVQVLYNEPTGREIYLFTDGKLVRIVKPGQG